MVSGKPVDISLTLAKVPIFAGFSAGHLQRLVARGRRHEYQQGQVVFQEGDAGANFHLIDQGLIKIYVTSRGGQDAVLALLRTGEFFGELSLIDGLPRAASASALEPTSTWEFTREDFLDLLGMQWDAAQHVLGVLAARLRRTDAVIADAAFLDVRARLAKRLLELTEQFGTPGETGAEITLRLRHRDLGELIGATRETTSRTLRGLEAMGAISQRRGTLIVERADLLRDVAGWG